MLLQLDAGIERTELPVDLGIGCITFACQRLGFATKGQLFRDIVLDCSAEDAQLNFCHVQPTAMFRGEMKLQLFEDPPRFCRWKDFIEAAGL